MLLTTVYDNDGIGPSDLVDKIFISRSLSAVSLQNGSFTQVMTYSGNYSELDLSFRLTCGEDFYGPECVFCVDTNDTRGHYSCDRSTGERVCLEGYQNSTTNCTECAPAEGCSEFVLSCLSFSVVCLPLSECLVCSIFTMQVQWVATAQSLENVYAKRDLKETTAVSVC